MFKQKILKKIIFLTAIIITILWATKTFLVTPQTAQAANLVTCNSLQAGDNIKTPIHPAIWNLGNDNLLRPFLDGDDFKTWHSDNKYEGHFKEVSPECLASYKTANKFPLYINRRPGSGLIKLKNSDQLYAILPNNTKAKISPEMAKILYGKNYPVREIILASFLNYYNLGKEITKNNLLPHPGMYISYQGKNYYVEKNNKLSEISSAAITANHIKTSYIHVLNSNLVNNIMYSLNSLNTYSTIISDNTQSIINSTTTINSATSSTSRSNNITTVTTPTTSDNNISNVSGGGGSKTSSQTTNNPSSNTPSTNTNSGGANNTTSSNTTSTTTNNTTTTTSTENNTNTNTTTTSTDSNQNTTTNTNSNQNSTTDTKNSNNNNSNNNSNYTTYYIRTDGGTASQCSGKYNVAYSSSVSPNCAWSHPFIALPPGGTPLISGGDTLVIGNGSYKMGTGAVGTANNDKCNISWSYDCIMATIPSGPSANQPTKILGTNWNNGCTVKPELWGSGRPWAIIDMTGSNNIELQCLEITDHSSCVESHSGNLTCNRNDPPFGDWASIGLRASDSANVLLKNLNIHGLAHTGILAGRLTNWTIENTKIVGNGWVGWDGDINGNDSNSGTMTFKKVNIDWNGCGETYPGLQPTGCWGQTAGGYGDGLGTGDTAGNWIFEDSTFLHNTSDGLDMLYHRSGGNITVRRVHAEGNAGNQIKVTGNAEITDSIIIGNCGYFDNQSFTYNVDACRALGNAVSVVPQNNYITMYNNSIYSNGDGLVYSDGGGTVKLRNNILYAGTDYWQPEETAFYLYSEGGSTFDHDYNLVYNAKSNNGICSQTDHNICGTDPKFTSLGTNFNLRLKTDSPAIDKGTTALTSIDYLSNNRPQGGGVDLGAYEIK